MTSLRVISAKTINLYNLYGGQRCYSVFPLYYVKPVYRIEEQNELWKTNQMKDLLYSSIRPALTSDTCSEFYDKEISLFTRYIMRKGNKILAKSLVQETLENVKRAQLSKYHKASDEEKNNIELDPKVIFSKAVENCKPLLELKICKKGGIKYRIPVAVHENRSRFLAMNWLIQATQTKGTKLNFPTELCKQLIDAYHNQGHAVMRKQDLHKECDANRAYAHFRWQK